MHQVLPFALFVGTAMSVIALPVLARILTDRGMHRTRIGGIAASRSGWSWPGVRGRDVRSDPPLLRRLTDVYQRRRRSSVA